MYDIIHIIVTLKSRLMRCKGAGGNYMEIDLGKIHISSYVKYRAIFLSAGAVHIFFLVFFIVIQQYFLAVFNVFSISLYVLGSFISVPKNSENIKFGWILAFYIEIMLHATLVSLVLGWGASFHLYATAVLPVAAYLLFLTCPLKKFIITMAVMVLVAAALMGGTMWYLNYYDSFALVSERFIRLIAYLNAVFASAIIFAFTLLFVLEVATMLNKLDNANKSLEFIATHDALTGLYNRHSLKKLFRELEQSKEPFCVILGDIDDFKKVNDTYGHDCGDTVLKSVADVISHNIGENDTACRWGGEEMLIVMWGEPEICFDTVTHIKEEISELDVLPKDSHRNVTMTFGFVFRSEERGIEALISAADNRLYIGKRSGKNVIIKENADS